MVLFGCKWTSVCAHPAWDSQHMSRDCLQQSLDWSSARTGPSLRSSARTRGVYCPPVRQEGAAPYSTWKWTCNSITWVCLFLLRPWTMFYLSIHNKTNLCLIPGFDFFTVGLPSLCPCSCCAWCWNTIQTCWTIQWHVDCPELWLCQFLLLILLVHALENWCQTVAGSVRAFPATWI